LFFIHESNKLNLSSKLSSLLKGTEFELHIVRFVWFMIFLNIYIYIYIGPLTPGVNRFVNTKSQASFILILVALFYSPNCSCGDSSKKNITMLSSSSWSDSCLCSCRQITPSIIPLLHRFRFHSRSIYISHLCSYGSYTI